MSWKDKALAKLEAERTAAKYDRYAQIMKDRTCETLADFCRQDEEFAQAVAQGGTFEDCMKAVAKNCGHGISDLEAFRRAARFYFPGAEVRFRMDIDLVGGAKEAKDSQEPSGDSGKAILLDLTDFW